MHSSQAEALYEQAQHYYVAGYDDAYIANQFAEQGIKDDITNQVLDRLQALRKADVRQSGRQLLLCGVSLLVLGAVATWWTAHSDSPYVVLLYGSMVVGVMLAAKGFLRSIGL